MGQTSTTETQGINEGSLSPLPHHSAVWNAWKPLLRRAIAVSFGGLGLAAIGALSMAQPSLPGASPPAGSEPPTLANVLSPAQWLAGSATAMPRPGSPGAGTDRSTAGPPPPSDPPPSDPERTTGAAGAGGPPPSAPPCVPNAPSPPAASGDITEGSAPSTPTVLPDGRIVLNSATPKELTTLPGIGQKRAEAIIALRTRLKGFRKLSDLLRVKGIGVKSLKKLEPKVVLDVPTESR
jgi:competence protein ComEA